MSPYHKPDNYGVLLDDRPIQLGSAGRDFRPGSVLRRVAGALVIPCTLMARQMRQEGIVRVSAGLLQSFQFFPNALKVISSPRPSVIGLMVGAWAGMAVGTSAACYS